MIRPINDAANPDHKKILHTPAVKGALEDAIALAIDLEETAKHHPNCVGLASNQIWDSPDKPLPHVFVALVGGAWRTFINATSKRAGKKFRFEEGCMSRPGHKGRKIRSEKITVTYTDIHGMQKTEQFSGFDAIVIQHELDHLTGNLI